MTEQDLRSRRWQACIAAEKAFAWQDWADQIPYINWPRRWLVKAVPPFTGAVIRYFITLPGKTDRVSVYLDCYGMLGAVDSPYWEVYPVDGDIARCGMHETDELIKHIKIALRQIK